LHGTQWVTFDFELCVWLYGNYLPFNPFSHIKSLNGRYKLRLLSQFLQWLGMRVILASEYI
jgi:hypothetical protein